MQAVILGWKRDKLDNYITDCEAITKELTLNNFSIYTGGGGGFMSAANKGAYEINKNKSFAITEKSLYEIEKQSNEYYINENLIICDSFAERKKKLFENKDLYIFFPGGVGTLDEFMDLMNLLKTGSIEQKPVILYGFKYWNSLKSWFEFNGMVFPDQHIEKIVDSVVQFNTIYNKLFNNKLIVKNEVSDEDIKSFEPSKNKNRNNIFMDCEGDINKLIDQIFDFTINEDLKKPLIDKSDSSHDSNDLKDYLYSKLPSESNSSYESDESEIEFIEIILDDEKSYSNSFNEENESNDNEIEYSDDSILYESEDSSNSSDDEN